MIAPRLPLTMRAVVFWVTLVEIFEDDNDTRRSRRDAAGDLCDELGSVLRKDAVEDCVDENCGKDDRTRADRCPSTAILSLDLGKGLDNADRRDLDDAGDDDSGNDDDCKGADGSRAEMLLAAGLCNIVCHDCDEDDGDCGGNDDDDDGRHDD